MVYLIVGVGLMLLWTWGRSEMIRRGGWRMFAGLASVILVVIGLAVTIKGDWWAGLPMVLLAIGSAAGGRIRPSAFRPAAGPAAQRPPDGMSAAEARAILGVGPEASVQDIRAAYKRLMQRAHPDKGGSVGLAAQLNAARDRLLKG